mmetsp:Transcript_43891/g.89663  ORF Transcript_43891/g.89663 Transcript_43891/m.89663 type:complete len:141 (-) Transcript_43891:532-954(-)|eukprot:CAMPEP_0181319716 /NCGR_PEP_ID=MMETSP1101-20121128/17727_1 /TAXON_ID=46948 /ORGANISM="Rhodomonas abbreviata, Strain Caron Lab Isolate" /LENGTH=140 /DNA_ID=CAMNT_0023427349 /DNA_START=263 /DNA_END=685 /DNA_ORIENTATION=+
MANRMGMGISGWVLFAGSCFGLVLGIMLGTLIGAPMAIVTYGSITDALRNNKDSTFSLDNGKTDIPGSVLAQKIEDDWGAVIRYIVYEQLLLSILVGAAVGLGFGFIATMAASTAKMAMSARSQASSAHADMRLRLLPMR